MPTDMNVIYTITLADGTKIPRLKLNGNNFVSQEELTEDIFEGNLSEVTISSENGTQVLHNVRLLQLTTYPTIPSLPGWYFVLQEIPKEELEMMQLRANMNYLAMMTDCEL